MPPEPEARVESSSDAIGDKAAGGIPPQQLLSADLIGEAVQQIPVQFHFEQSVTKWYHRFLSFPSRDKVEIVGLIIDTILRVAMSGVFAYFAYQWLERVCAIVEKQTTEHHLSDAVLIALLSTTTLNVLGLLYFVANYLFPKLKEDKGNGAPKPPSPPTA